MHRISFRAAAAAALLASAFGLTPAAWAGNFSVTVVDKEGKPVQDAVVVLVPTGTAVPRTPLPMQVTINQEKMRFIPAVSLVGVGAKARFVNSDPWEHHVRASAAGAAQFSAAPGEGFELRMDGKAEGKPAKTADASFDKAGAVLLGCHLHASMRGNVFVSDSPWAVLTNAEGVATFEDVPEGVTKYRVWQADQIIDLPGQQVTLTAAPARATMQLSVVPRRRRV
ncbi:MAG: plastocyanin [Comamonadaceae bacterium]|nr:MAG: plastocyanin [Comamonadaceae bacterium]